MTDNSLKKGRYTKYSNKIGLYSNNKGSFIKNDTEVVLNFPFKDTVLEAGMSKEDVGREERFLHLEIDSKDIDTLEEPKVLTHFRYIDKDGQKPLTADNEIKFFDEDGNLNQNLLIKGNNLLALHTLKGRLAGQVKLVYIDPPYNTGNDGFRYNDSFNHSAWLSFMRNRLEVARELLSDDGAIFVHCDDNEQAYLKVLMDEIFGRDNYRNMILTRRFDKNLNTQFVDSGLKTMNIGADYVLAYAKSPSFQFNPVYRKASDERASKGYWKGFYNSPNRPTMRYEILGVTIDDGQWKWERNKALEAVQNYEEYLANHSEVSLEEYWNNTGKTKKFIRKNPSGASSGKNKGIEHWIAPSEGILRSSNWTDILTTETNSNVNFNNPKSESVMTEIIRSVTDEGDLVLDFCLGSGTTSVVAQKMNRRWVGVEQMDYIETVAFERLKDVVISEKGSFVFFELKKYNQEYIDRIIEANSLSELEDLYVDMRNNAFLKFWFDRKEFEKDENFRNLDISERKKKLIEVLDENQLYLNYADMNDTRHKVSNDEKVLTDKFYGTNED